ncbi:MAG: DUF4192 domain-containing protein [Propionibacteriales bacterium]|nr:DUF4192 domain-containing protein [Propionibacteriales bacterium]
MSASEPAARLAVHDLDDLVGLAPYLVGFQPESSLVVLVVDGGQVGVTARVDLAPLTQVAAMNQLISRLFERFPDGEAWCLAYTEDLALAWTVLDLAAEVVGEERLGRLVQVGRQRWRADHAAGLSGSVRASAAAAHAAVLGMPLRDSRATLVAQVAGPAPSDLAAAEAAVEAAVARVASMGRLARRRRAERLAAAAESRADLVLLAVLAADAEIQQLIVDGLSGAEAPAAVQRWTAVVAVSPPAFAAAPLGLLGVAAWLTGDGALQTVCLERLDKLAAWVPLAAMLDWINATVLPPAAWPHYRQALVGALADHARLLASAKPA